MGTRQKREKERNARGGKDHRNVFCTAMKMGMIGTGASERRDGSYELTYKERAIITSQTRVGGKRKNRTWGGPGVAGRRKDITHKEAERGKLSLHRKHQGKGGTQGTRGRSFLTKGAGKAKAK